MRYNDVNKTDLKGLHKVIESFNIDLNKAIKYLKSINPIVKKTDTGYYLTNNSLLTNLSNL